MYTLYTKSDCSVCESVKQLLNYHNLSYKEIIIGRDITREEVLQKFPHVKTAPIILDDLGFETTPSRLTLLLENH